MGSGAGVLILLGKRDYTIGSYPLGWAWRLADATNPSERASGPVDDDGVVSALEQKAQGREGKRNT